MYSPGVLDQSSLSSLAQSMRDELSRLAQQLSQPADYMALQTLHVAPTRYFEGMVIKADGTNWNPGSGAGVYVRIGSAWVKM